MQLTFHYFVFKTCCWIFKLQSRFYSFVIVIFRFNFVLSALLLSLAINIRNNWLFITLYCMDFSSFIDTYLKELCISSLFYDKRIAIMLGICLQLSHDEFYSIWLVFSCKTNCWRIFVLKLFCLFFFFDSRLFLLGTYTSFVRMNNPIP